MEMSSEIPQNLIDELAAHYRAIIEILGEDPEREGLFRTPERAARAMLYATRGYGQSVDDVVNGALFEASEQQLVVVKDIEFYSLCEHHILPFFGHVSIGYLPDKKIVGLSKVARLVDMFARRLQVQERMTSELADVLMETLGAKGIIVRTEARHLCMAMRGVQKQESATVTVATRGVLRSDVSLRQEFFASLK
ncbi:MAG: GTP cyclohydrolase I FolE [Paramuribaculum sp.]|nr:GTP cyclohydrolase I FolE [Paramuribaculum sp.]MDE6324259.1 GTP cyclohydrolase I FolE [Paramuribaculum sp.]MDE6488517.1 GTP cyclohydrolase I FolE [Paramuribaculum sp.]